MHMQENACSRTIDIPTPGDHFRMLSIKSTRADCSLNKTRNAFDRCNPIFK